ncbi:MAG TPA: substrate-binding domain-containing protein [Spirochaetales bacterium]|nr:substrate-binding domain-containing protein [Spirochaetales bacterium]HRY55415.1 substrate-binding domain-containing protein [Spirochaetia bacterium]HRZ64188.1 substrate-binding domain-containing protein [Spirochaetia bacterium]
MIPAQAAPRRLAAPLLATFLFSAAVYSCSESEAGKPLIGVALADAKSPFSTACLAAMERGAEGRALLAVMDGKGEGAAQLGQVDKLISRGAKTLVVAPPTAAEAAAVIARAKAANVPLVLLGEEPRIEELRSWDKLLFVGHAASRAGPALASVLAASWGSVPASDRDRNGRMRLAFAGLSSGSADEERNLDCLASLDGAGIEVDGLSARGAEAIAALASRPGSRVEAVAAADAASAAAAADALGPPARGLSPVPVVAFLPGRPAPSLSELSGLRLAGAVAGDPAAVGSAALDAAYALAFGRDPAEAGFELIDGKSLILPYAEVRSPDFDPPAN